MSIPVLTTDRLILRPFVHEDLSVLAVLHAEESFWWYPLRGGMSMEQTTGFNSMNFLIPLYDLNGDDMPQNTTVYSMQVKAFLCPSDVRDSIEMLTNRRPLRPSVS